MKAGVCMGLWAPVQQTCCSACQHAAQPDQRTWVVCHGAGSSGHNVRHLEKVPPLRKAAPLAAGPSTVTDRGNALAASDAGCLIPLWCPGSCSSLAQEPPNACAGAAPPQLWHAAALPGPHGCGVA
eukprot:1158015-Pelagomonas_calceolata.AAC.5